MAENYAIRITRSFLVLERAIGAAALLADKALAYEHIGTATEKVHVHLLLVGVRCDKKTLQKRMNEHFKLTDKLTGNGDWSFKTKDKNYGPVEDSVKYITYMTKGKFDPKYNKGYTQEQLDEAKALWVEPVKAKSQWAKWYAEFELMIPNDLHKEATQFVGTNLKETFSGWSHVRTAAGKFMYEKKGDMRRQTRNEAKDLWFTYCWKHKVAMPMKITENMW